MEVGAPAAGASPRREALGGGTLLGLVPVGGSGSLGCIWCHRRLSNSHENCEKSREEGREQIQRKAFCLFVLI